MATNRVGRWRSDAARDRYLRAYDRAFALLPAPADTFDVDTRFGTVRAYRFARSGPPGPGAVPPPVVLLPGRASGAPMWSANLAGFTAQHDVYALDAVGDAGRSVQTAPLAGPADQAAWLEDLFDGLGLDRVQTVGHSMGGWNAADHAIHHPDRVESLVLLEPIMVFAGLAWRMYLDTLPSMLPFLPDAWRRAGLARIGGAPAARVDGDPIAELVDAATGYAAALPAPRRPAAARLARLTMPVFVALGGRSAVHDAAAAARAARRLPTAEVRVWPAGTHSLPMQVPDELAAALDGFLR